MTNRKPEANKRTREQSLARQQPASPEKVAERLEWIDAQRSKLGRYTGHYFSGMLPEMYPGLFIYILHQQFGILDELKLLTHSADAEFVSWLERRNLKSTYVADWLGRTREWWKEQPLAAELRQLAPVVRNLAEATDVVPVNIPVEPRLLLNRRNLRKKAYAVVDRRLKQYFEEGISNGRIQLLHIVASSEATLRIVGRCLVDELGAEQAARAEGVRGDPATINRAVKSFWRAFQLPPRKRGRPPGSSRDSSIVLR